jgi:hypothetical protein
MKFAKEQFIVKVDCFTHHEKLQRISEAGGREEDISRARESSKVKVDSLVETIVKADDGTSSGCSITTVLDGKRCTCSNANQKLIGRVQVATTNKGVMDDSYSY